MKKIVLCVPSRQRPIWFKRFVDSIFASANNLDNIRIVARLDSDDWESHQAYKDCLRNDKDIVLIAPTKVLSCLWQDCYDVCKDWGDLFGHFGDDITIDTKDFDLIINEAVEKFPKGIGACYGDDLLQHESLMTHGFYSKAIIEAVGYFMPSLYSANYNDTNWTWICRNLKHAGFPDCFQYLSNLITEHHHPTAGKASWSEPVYELQQIRMKRDKCDQIYLSKENERKNDLEKILKVLRD